MRRARPLNEQSAQVFEGHWYAPLQRWQGRLCGVLSNPPYITSKELLSLQVRCCRAVPHAHAATQHDYHPTSHEHPVQAEVQLHEPSLALDGGTEDGLDCLIEVCDGAISMLRPGGFLAVETAGAHAAGGKPVQARAANRTASGRC